MRKAILGNSFNKPPVTVDPAKFKGILDTPMPKSQAELRPFLGIAGYY